MLGASSDESSSGPAIHVHIDASKALTLAQTFVTRHGDAQSAAPLQLMAPKELAGGCKTNVKVGVVNSDA